MTRHLRRRIEAVTDIVIVVCWFAFLTMAAGTDGGKRDSLDRFNTTATERER